MVPGIRHEHCQYIGAKAKPKAGWKTCGKPTIEKSSYCARHDRFCHMALKPRVKGGER
tara:strand:+ start:212 stop:385 length:174 start_codon:yes stop_codon:yes gene_type:complete